MSKGVRVAGVALVALSLASWAADGLAGGIALLKWTTLLGQSGDSAAGAPPLSALIDDDAVVVPAVRKCILRSTTD